MSRIHRVRRVPGIISTDDIIPARYKHMYTDPQLLAPHVFEGRYPGLATTLHEGDAVVGDDTFGIGSSREQAVSALLACGVRLLVAPEFGRIFYRNCWNLSLPAIEADTTGLVEEATIRVDLDAGEITADGVVVARFSPPPEMMTRLLQSGGLLPLVFGATGTPETDQG